MDGTRQFVLAACVGLATLAGPAEPAYAQRFMPPLNSVAEQLHLTKGGANEWLDRLGVSGNPPAAEHLLAVTFDGQVVAMRDGTAQQVVLGVDLDRRLLTSGAGIVIVHNHPASTGLSANDLQQLEKPGVAAIVAIGHDGSVYLAAAAPGLDRRLFVANQYASARAAVDRSLRNDVAGWKITQANAERHLAHIVALALSKAGVIEYIAALAPDRRASYDEARTVFGIAVAAAAARVEVVRRDSEHVAKSPRN
jgi:hypothetical protein